MPYGPYKPCQAPRRSSPVPSSSTPYKEHYIYNQAKANRISIFQNTVIMSAPNDEFQPGTEGLETGTTADTVQNDYKSRPGQSEIRVVGDEAPIEDGINANSADSDAQLGSSRMCRPFTDKMY
jgi:hypothetical protein